jgi:hypothetical protein
MPRGTKKERRARAAIARRYWRVASELEALHAEGANYISRYDNNAQFEMHSKLRAIAVRIRAGYPSTDYV